MTRIIEEKWGEVILHDDNFDLKIDRELYVCIKRKDQKNFERLKQKKLVKGLPRADKEKVLNIMADYVIEQISQ